MLFISDVEPCCSRQARTSCYQGVSLLLLTFFWPWTSPHFKGVGRELLYSFYSRESTFSTWERRAVSTQGQENAHNFWITLQQMSWTCSVLVGEMLQIIVNLILTWLTWLTESEIWPSKGKSHVFELAQSVAENFSVKLCLSHVGFTFSHVVAQQLDNHRNMIIITIAMDAEDCPMW